MMNRSPLTWKQALIVGIIWGLCVGFILGSHVAFSQKEKIIHTNEGK